MVKVCIHHPLNPEKSNLCVKLRAHEIKETTDLVFPFSDDPDQTDLALSNLVKEKQLSHAGSRKIYEEIKREALEKLQQEFRHPIWTIPEAPTISNNGLNLNDPRIAEINIKYRD